MGSGSWPPSGCLPGSRHTPLRPSPHSPKLNGRVERLNRTAREECYDLTLEDFTVSALSRAARRWEHTYNHIRPHQALGMLTPAQFLAQSHKEQLSRTS
ncbi:MAG: transposase [Thermoflexaceae bacterium]|nr:transposase [Thermoflexaceae bacterium]